MSRQMAMDQKILGVNTRFQSLNYENFDECSFTACTSFLDYDAIIISADHIVNAYSSDRTYENRVVLTEYDSKQIKEDFSRIRDQISELLNLGKNIFVIMGINENCYIYTGQKKTSGTGKNEKTTVIVDVFDMYSFLPVKIRTTHIVGKNIGICAAEPYKDYFAKTKECFYYKTYFSVSEAKPLLKIKSTEKVISSVIKYGNGHIVFLPFPYYKEDYKTVGYWKEAGKLYLDALFELNAKLSVIPDNSVLPEWANQFSILNEREANEKLNKEERRLQTLLNQIERQKDLIHEICKYKTLLTSSGTLLENIVKTVLIELGFQIMETERGRSDIIAKYKDTDIVAEIKGVTKSAAEKHAAQLEKWVAQFYSEKGYSPKPLLIVNAFCETPVFDRTDEVFPNQVLSYCEARKHILISTVQLLCLYIETKSNPALLDTRLNELFSTVGIYQRYLNVADYLIPNELPE